MGSHQTSPSHIHSVRKQAQTGSNQLTNEEKADFISKKRQTCNFIRLGESKEQFSSNSIRSAALALKQMAKASSEALSHEDFLFEYPLSPGSTPRFSNNESILNPCNCSSPPNFTRNITGTKNKGFDIECQTDELLLNQPAAEQLTSQPHPCYDYTLPLTHFEVPEENVEQETNELVNCFPPFQPNKEVDLYSTSTRSPTTDEESLYQVLATSDWSEIISCLAHAQDGLDSPFQQNFESTAFVWPQSVSAHGTLCCL